MEFEAVAQKEWFIDWFNTDYYHLLYRNRNHEEAAQFINRLIEFLNPTPGARMLDLACGSGRHSLQLAKKDFEVVGLDLSENSIEKANLSAKENPEFFVHDMRLPFRIHYFDYIFNFFTSFGYFESVRDHQKAIQSIAAGLKAGGILVIDYLNPVATESKLIPVSNDEADGIQFFIQRKSDDQFFYKLIEVKDTKKNETYHFSERVSKIYLDDFKKLFKDAGLNIRAVFGDYNLQPFIQENSDRMIMIATKS